MRLNRTTFPDGQPAWNLQYQHPMNDRVTRIFTMDRERLIELAGLVTRALEEELGPAAVAEAAPEPLPEQLGPRDLDYLLPGVHNPQAEQLDQLFDWVALQAPPRVREWWTPWRDRLLDTTLGPDPQLTHWYLRLGGLASVWFRELQRLRTVGEAPEVIQHYQERGDYTVQQIRAVLDRLRR